MKSEDMPAGAAPKINAGSGFTKREYAAILLKVPDSGCEWLDKMIRNSQEIDAEFLHD